MVRRIAFITALVLAFAVPFSASAAFPEREIRILIPYKAGGQSDLSARKLADIVQKEKLLPVPMLVVNMPSGNTADCLNALKAAKPDGYTLVLHHTALLTMETLGILRISWRDFDLVGQVMTMPMFLVVNADSPWKTAQDMIDAVKKEPGKYSCSVPGTGGSSHFAAIQFFMKVGIMDKINQQPLAGATETIVALMGKRCDMRASTGVDGARFMRSGEQRALVSIDSKSPIGFPDVKPASDFGLTDAIVLRNGFFAPKGTPKEVTEALAKAIKAAVEHPEFQEFCKSQTATPEFQNSAEWAKTLTAAQAAIKQVAATLKK
ncbi:tripartite tricarboxylate transporter substrate binding protein [Desulfovibrio sp. OttesenSCG-928-O18]|nr:tripartite tricarboxylate transporter substrate binding protein [Desulfovibrio sp. OttesenSCG-928-O18]